MKVLTPEVACSKCAGRGHVPLSPELDEVFRLLIRKGSMSAGQLARHVKAEVGITALNQRLERLRSLKLLNRFRRGHEWIYLCK